MMPNLREVEEEEDVMKDKPNMNVNKARKLVNEQCKSQNVKALASNKDKILQIEKQIEVFTNVFENNSNKKFEDCEHGENFASPMDTLDRFGLPVFKTDRLHQMLSFLKGL
jgi:hypothetical protein